eukprot:TRINITY_DN7081_c0_g3_i1.p1 TRINITY_DN7081_c0_g3~~TRINITY_DN7081_c0_g3_i1.p1  ORF type:complete len:736 (-),score=189.25 TRINITY_DN7081_c0_g3_i1:125-2332(-)
MPQSALPFLKELAPAAVEDESVAEYVCSMLEDETSDIAERIEGVAALFVAHGVSKTESAAADTVKAILARMFPTQTQAKAQANGKSQPQTQSNGKSQTQSQTQAPVLLAKLVKEEDRTVDRLVRQTMKASNNFNTLMSGVRIISSDDHDLDDGSLRARLKREKKLVKVEKRTTQREKQDAMQRSAILDRITNMPMVVHTREHDGAMRDIVFTNISMALGGLELMRDTNFTLVYGRKYGLVGRNGIGKTTLLKHIAAKEFPGIPRNLQILHIEQEVDGDEETVLQSVLCTDVERDALLEEEKELLASTAEQGQSERLKELYQRLDEIDASSAPARAASILAGLGFTTEDQQRKTKEFSGGWRMRVALARALFISPDILLLDEPTNHLDLHAVLWLEDYLLSWSKTLIIVSHAREFLNSVVTDILHFHDKTIKRYKGNYDEYEQQRAEVLKSQLKAFETQERQKAHIQKFVDRFRYNAKRASMVQSRIKVLSKMTVTEVSLDPSFQFNFPNPEQIQAPVIQVIDVTFGYSPERVLFRNLNLNVDLDSRIALVGPNGVGKSTLLSLIFGDFEPMNGIVLKNGHLRLGRFSQHFVDQINMSQTPLEMMQSSYPEVAVQLLRAHLGSMGVSGAMALQPIYSLSGGQKARVAFAKLAYSKPHIMLLDEPTNHLDLDTVQALIQALSVYEGGVLIVSHDEHLISATCDELWLLQGQTVTTFDGDFTQYKKWYLEQCARLSRK